MMVGGQNLEEWDAFAEYLQDKDIRSYLEIGAREGYALRYLVERLPSIKRVVAVDFPGAKWGYPDSGPKLQDNLNELPCEAMAIFGDSTDQEVIDRAAGEYDLVFIDGDHRYEGVLADYTNYGPMGRIVALHDINQQPGSKAYGVTKLWGEIKGDESVEIIRKGSRKGIGIC